MSIHYKNIIPVTASPQERKQQQRCHLDEYYFLLHPFLSIRLLAFARYRAYNSFHLEQHTDIRATTAYFITNSSSYVFETLARASTMNTRVTRMQGINVLSNNYQLFRRPEAPSFPISTRASRCGFSFHLSKVREALQRHPVLLFRLAKSLFLLCHDNPCGFSSSRASLSPSQTTSRGSISVQTRALLSLKRTIVCCTLAGLCVGSGIAVACSRRQFVLTSSSMMAANSTNTTVT